MQIADIIHCIERSAPPAAAAAWDTSGVQIAPAGKTADHLAAMLDPVPSLIEEALAQGADLILTHHPLSLKPYFLNQQNDICRVAALLLPRGIGLYSAHTSLDANLAGPAAWLADALRLDQRAPLEATAPAADPASLPYGFGLVGNLPTPLPYARFTAALGSLVRKQRWIGAGHIPERVSRVAYCPGSGSSLVQAAQRAGADVYLTGDITYHTALAAPIRILDLGHFVLEEAMMRLFAEHLQTELPQLSVTYFPSTDPLTVEHAASGEHIAYSSPVTPKEERR